jgi:hypothetical protein
MSIAAAACVAAVFVLRPNQSKLPTVAAAPAVESPAVANAESTRPETVTRPASEVAVDVTKARRLPTDTVTDANPAPALEDGLKLGRRVASVGNYSPSRDFGTYGSVTEGMTGFLRVGSNPRSSLSFNVNPSSGDNMRRFLATGRAPSADAVRVQEMLNYFAFSPTKSAEEGPVSASVEVAAAPWNPAHRLVRIGLRGRELAESGASQGNLDVKLQVEFNPAQAKSYRLIGYEDNLAPRTGAADERGEGPSITTGHVITALYEVVPVGTPDAPVIDATATTEATELPALSPGIRRHDLLTLQVRYTVPTLDVSRKIEIPLVDPETDFAKASKDFKFAAAVAGFGMILKESPHKGTATYDNVIRWAEDSEEKEDPAGRRKEFINMVKQAKAAVE